MSSLPEQMAIFRSMGYCHFKATLGPGSMLCWIAFLDCPGYEFNIDARVTQ